MNQIYVPSKGPDDWRALLAKPESQWKKGRSAMELAMRWEASAGMPHEIRDPLAVRFQKIRSLIILPEYKVNLPGGSRASQNDIWILCRSESELISIAVEGKVDETFGTKLSERLAADSPTDRTRWSFLKNTLGLTSEPDHSLRYQLFHRTASAIIQAEEFGAGHAVLVVHSFSKDRAWFSDYEAFVSLFGIRALSGSLQTSNLNSKIQLHFLWASGPLT